MYCFATVSECVQLHSLLTSTSSGSVAIFSLSVLNIILAICSDVNPMDPTRSGRPQEPMNKVSPVKACERTAKREIDKEI